MWPAVKRFVTSSSIRLSTGETALVVLITAALMTSHWGVGRFTAWPSAMAFAVLITWLAVIDARRGVLPNALTYALILAGLTDAILRGGSEFAARMIGAAIGFSVFAAIGLAYERYRGQTGLGMGDAKFLAGAGAWLGWAVLPTVLLTASFSALVWALPLVLRHAAGSRIRIRFGPFLAIGAWVGWLILLSS